MVPLTLHRPIKTMDGLTQLGSSSHCGPWIPTKASALLMAPTLPFSKSKKTEAAATEGVILGR